MRKTYKDYAKEVLNKNKSGLHIKQIAEKISDEFPLLSIDELANKIGAAISKDINNNKRKTRFRNIKGDRGQNRKGMYALKKQRKSKEKKIVETIQNREKTYEEKPSKERDRFTGSAGEFAVISELLFRQFNASIISVDEGIDIIATKDKETYYIQAKTGYYRDKKLQANINFNQFERHNTFRTYYIIVFRYKMYGRYQNEYFVINSRDLRKMLGEKKINNSKSNINLVIYMTEDGFLLNNEYDLNDTLNNFEQIKP